MIRLSDSSITEEPITTGERVSPRASAAAAPQCAAEYRHLALQLYYDLSAAPDSPRSVLLTMAGGEDHSAESSSSLAVSMAAEVGRKVLLIDANPGSDLSASLGCVSGAGLTDVLDPSGVSVGELAAETNAPNLYFLPAGQRRGPLESGWPERLALLLRTAAKEFDFVIVSGGSVLQNSLALAAAPAVGCVLLLVAENETEKRDLDAARQILNRCRARRTNLISIVRGSGAVGSRTAV